MKKTLRTLMMGMMALLAGNALTSCSNDDEPQVAQQEGKTGYVEFTISRGADTRTAYALNEDKGLDVTWSKGDKMVVFYKVQTADEIIEVFDIVEGVGEKTAKFAKSDSQLADKSGIIGIAYRPNYDASKTISEYLFDFSTQEGDLDNLGKYDLFSFEASLEEGKITPLGKSFFYPTMVFLHFPTDIDFGTGTTTSDFVFSGGGNKHASYSEGIEGDITVENVSLTNGKLSQDLYVAVYHTTPTSFSVGGKTFSLPGGLKAGNIYTFAQENLKDITPLTIEALGEGTITIKNPYGLTIKYSKDGGATKTTSSANPIYISVNAGDKVQFFGDNEAYAKDGSYNHTNIQCSGSSKVYGNIMSLISSTDYSKITTFTGTRNFYELFFKNLGLIDASGLILPATTLASYCYAYMFEGCYNLASVPKLPATTLADNCYLGMFYSCNSLVSAPELSVTTLAEYCYYEMFSNCTSLTEAPELPATTLEKGCYLGMFEYCTSLTKAPELPATMLADYCYSYMFQYCTNLSSVTCLAENPNPEVYTNDWLDGVAATGNFYHAKDVEWPSGTSGIPAGWTQQEY